MTPRPAPFPLPPASPEALADEAADRQAIAAEPPLPAPGTLARGQLDQHQAATVAGLLAQARRPRCMCCKREKRDVDGHIRRLCRDCKKSQIARCDARAEAGDRHQAAVVRYG